MFAVAWQRLLPSTLPVCGASSLIGDGVSATWRRAYGSKGCFPFFPEILLSRKPAKSLGRQLVVEKNDG